MTRLFKWNLLNLKPHSKPVIVRDAPTSPEYQIIIPGVGKCVAKADDHGVLHLYCQASLYVYVGAEPYTELHLLFVKGAQ